MAGSFMQISFFNPRSEGGSERVGIVRFLMAIERPDARVKEAIESAANWFEAVKPTGKQIEKPNPSLPKGHDKVIVENPNAALL
jgi:PelA/Pel-15E family pectate lyase